MKSFVLGFAAAMFVSAAAYAQCDLSPQAQAGEKVSASCKGCHLFEADKKSRPTGPNLALAFGREVGSQEDFTRYSKAMQAAKAKGAIWDEASLLAYLENPKAHLEQINGEKLPNGMVFALRDAAKRTEVVAYLKEISACAQ